MMSEKGAELIELCAKAGFSKFATRASAGIRRAMGAQSNWCAATSESIKRRGVALSGLTNGANKSGDATENFGS